MLTVYLYDEIEWLYGYERKTRIDPLFYKVESIYIIVFKAKIKD